MAFYAHRLIERKTAKSQRTYRWIYNATTMLTLVVITLINYFVLYILLTISITLFVPVSLFNSWTSAQAEFTFMNYVRLIWFVSSLGLLAGAMGSTVENEEKSVRLLIHIVSTNVIKKLKKNNKRKNSNMIHHIKKWNSNLQVMIVMMI